MRRLLMVAFHFPPAAESSGIQRTLRFVQHLPAHGWQPVVLSAHPRAYRRTSDDLMGQIPPGVEVVRAFALDAARHLSIAGRYPAFLALPDRWQSWRFGAVRTGLSLIERLGVDAIWSTYPIATAHQIGAELQRRSGLPWIADFRDPMAQDGYPPDERTWRSFKAIEEVAYDRATRCVFTTPSAAAEYRARYPKSPPERTVLIENGYDEETFAGLDAPAGGPQPLNPGRVTLIHSGIVYPSERDPTQLMEALALLRARGAASPDTLRVVFRGSEHDAMLTDKARAAGVLDFIDLQPPVPYKQALAEMMRADGLLVLQASNCNAQVPAKLYEYLRAGRPIIGLTDPVGDTAGLLRRSGIEAIAPLDSAPAIADLLATLVGDPARRARCVASPEVVGRASRRSRALELAALLDAAVPQRPAQPGQTRPLTAS